jgi:hypothetical protein
MDNEFAAACRDQHSVEELEALLRGPISIEDCEFWEIEPDVWSASVALALNWKIAEMNENV